MQASQRLLNFVTNEEGLVTKAYPDAVGVWTIGVGHTSRAGGLQVKRGMTITRNEAMNILKKDIAKFMNRTEKAMPGAKVYEIEGSTSFDLNTGAINKASWVKLWRDGRSAAAAISIMLWVKAGGRTLRGLEARRRRERDIIFYNIWPENLSRVTSTDYQPLLVKLGYLDDISPINEVTILAVKKFQKDKGLIVDGVVGPATFSTLKRALATKRSNQVAVTTGVGGTGGSVIAGAPLDGPDTVLIATAAIVVLVIAGSWFWRNRGRFINVKRRVTT